MSCNSAIYTVNASGVAITPPDGQFAQIPFGSVIRRFGKAVQLDGGSILCCGSGYYDVDIDANLVPTAEGEISIQLFQDGVAVPGTLKTITAAAAGDYILVPVDTLVRNCGCDCNSALTLGVNAACTVASLTATVEKV